MYFLYSLLLTLGFVALLPRFVLDAVRHGKYAAGFRERAGELPPLDTKGKPVIWLHCVSVGETQAARPLVRQLRTRYPSHALVVSTVTLTGQKIARELFSQEAAAIFYFPFDFRWAVRRTLRAVRPAAVLVLETELWPNFLRECRARRVPVALVNGRVSEISFRRYKLIRRFIARVLGDIQLALMQSDTDAARVRSLGLAPERIQVLGNIKFDADAGADESALTSELRERFRLDDARPLVVAASTHEPEERIVIEAFESVCASTRATPRPRLLIAPRHPERFAEVASLLTASSALTFSRRSAPPDREADASCDVILLDSIGELRAAYAPAALVFVGGSIVPRGGHNLLEPAAHAKCVVTGAHTSNFDAITRALLERDALVQLPEATDAAAPALLARAFQELLSDDERRRRTGERARGVLEENRGATARTVESLADLLASADANKLN